VASRLRYAAFEEPTMNTKTLRPSLRSFSSLSLLVAMGVSCGGLAACSGSSAGLGGGIDLSKATLKRAQSCEDLTAALRDDARSKLNRRIDAEIRGLREGWSYGYGYGYGDSTNAGAAAPPQVAGAGGGSTATAPAPAHSDTETQVKGVDEADIVKTDGNHIYLLHGDKFIVANSWPAPTLGAVTSATIEGQPSEMFVANGRVVVFSRVDGAPIYAAAHVTPRPGYDDQYSPYGGGYTTAGVAGGAPAGGVMLPPGGGGGGGYYANPLTKITVLQISDAGVTPTRELYFEGEYSTSRRIDARVRVILNGGGHGPALDYAPQMPQSAPSPSLPVGGGGTGNYVPPSTATTPTVDDQIAAWEGLRAKNLALIAATTYADWVPTAFVKSGGGQVTASPTQCADFYVPTAGTTESGMTQIESIDLDAPDALPRSTTILGAVSTVYGNTNALVLASQAYVDPWVLRQAYPPPLMTNGAGGTVTTPVIPVQTMNYTHLHAFDIVSDPTTALYTGSGTVPGSVKDQFAIDEKNGAVRVATTEQRSGPARTDGKENTASHVYVLTNDQGKLALTGDAGEIAPGEELYATRFVGDKAYIVTWHVTDPLFVVDVANAAAPRILGQVQIPGFSTYIHPLDDTHLLTIGRETDMTGHQHDGSYWYGIALQVFDVTNPLQPLQQYKYVFDGGEYAQSEAMEEHKAFTYFDDKKLLAFPYVHEGSYSSYAQSSTLQVFKVGVAEGIQKLGAVDHSALLGTLSNGNYGYCGGYFDGAVRRGVFVENVVYSISYGGILANDVGQLAAGAPPIATMKLDPPTLSTGCQ
jgi:Beta propeller domain